MMSEGEACVCQKCNQTFSCISHLRRHTKNEHRNESVPYHIIRMDREGSPETGIIDNRLDNRLENPPAFNVMQQANSTNHNTASVSRDDSLSNENTISVSRDNNSNSRTSDGRSLSHPDPINLLLDMPVSTAPANIPPDQHSTQQTVQSYIESFSKNLEHLSSPKGERKFPGMLGPSMLCTSEMDQFKEAQYLHQLSGYQCSECGQYLENKQVLQEHLTTAHDKIVKSYPCLYCNNVFFSPQSILAHLRAVLSSSKPSPAHLVGIKRCSKHICPMCEVIHVSAFKLKHHILKNKCKSNQPPFHCDDIITAKLECMKLSLKSYKPKRIISKEMWLTEQKIEEPESTAITDMLDAVHVSKPKPLPLISKPLPNVASRPNKSKKLRHPTQTRTEQSEQRGVEEVQGDGQGDRDDQSALSARNQYLIAQPVNVRELHYLGPNPTGCASNTPFISQFRHPQYITYNMDNFLYHPQVNLAGHHYLAAQNQQQDQQQARQFNSFASLSSQQNHSAVKLARSTTQSPESSLLQVQQHTSDKEHSCIGCNRKYPSFELLVQHCRETGCPDIM